MQVTQRFTVPLPLGRHGLNSTALLKRYISACVHSLTYNLTELNSMFCGILLYNCFTNPEAQVQGSTTGFVTNVKKMFVFTTRCPPYTSKYSLFLSGPEWNLGGHQKKMGRGTKKTACELFPTFLVSENVKEPSHSLLLLAIYLRESIDFDSSLPSPTASVSDRQI